MAFLDQFAKFNDRQNNRLYSNWCNMHKSWKVHFQNSTSLLHWKNFMPHFSSTWTFFRHTITWTLVKMQRALHLSFCTLHFWPVFWVIACLKNVVWNFDSRTNLSMICIRPIAVDYSNNIILLEGIPLTFYYSFSFYSDSANMHTDHIFMFGRQDFGRCLGPPMYMHLLED